MVKLTDVARLAKVSPTTVSRVINNRGYISEATRNKVFSAMKKLNYQPNSIARSLTGKTTGLVGLIFSDTSNPFFGEVVSKLESRLFLKGYKTILCNSASSPEKEKKYLKMLSANQVDGIISGTHNLNIEEYDKLTSPIISFDRNLSKKIPVVSSDNYSGGKKATEYLLRSGFKKIHIISSKITAANPTNDRVKAYEDVLKAHELTPHLHQLSFNMNPQIKKMMIKQILEQEDVDAIFCTDDLTALLCLEVAKDLGIKVPQELGIVGYDGTDLIQTYFPSLVTVKQPIDEICDLLVDLLIQKINKKEFPDNTHYELPVKLVFNE